MRLAGSCVLPIAGALIAGFVSLSTSGATPQVSTVRELGARLGLPLESVYKAVASDDKDAIVQLTQYGLKRGMGPVQKNVERQLSDLRRSCENEKTAVGPCMEGAERFEMELKRLEDLSRGKRTPTESRYLSAVIFHHDAVEGFFEPEFRKNANLCKKKKSDPACRARRKELLELGSVTLDLAELAGLRLEDRDEARQEELRKSLALKLAPVLPAAKKGGG